MMLHAQGLSGASRMVMGHTIQSDGINAVCGGAALRVDVGLSAGCGNGRVEALEILGDGQRVLRLREGLPPLDITPQPETATATAGLPAVPPREGTPAPAATASNVSGSPTRGGEPTQTHKGLSWLPGFAGANAAAAKPVPA